MSHTLREGEGEGGGAVTDSAIKIVRILDLTTDYTRMCGSY